MKTSRIALATAGLLSIFLIASTAAAAPIPQPTATWQGFAFHGFDPYYRRDVTGFTAGSTATLTLTVSNPYGDYLNVTGAKVMFDWNGNYSGSYTKSNSYRINGNTVLPVTITVNVPATSVASNLVSYGYDWSLNYTRSSTPSNPQQAFGSGEGFAVLSTDQASALSLMQQLPETLMFSGETYTYCATSGFFHTAEATILCQQSQQQANQALNLYSLADFTDAKNNFQTAANDWNQALSIDKSTGGNLELAGTVQGWGFLLLGIGALIAGLGGMLYAWKRPRELRGTAAATATH